MVSGFIRNRGLDELQQVCIAFSLPQGSLDVGFLIGKQAAPQTPVRRQPKAIACLAKMVAQGPDQSDFARGAVKSVPLSRSVERPSIHGPDRREAPDRFENFLQILFSPTGIISMKRM